MSILNSDRHWGTFGFKFWICLQLCTVLWGYNSFSRFIISGMTQGLLYTNAFSKWKAKQSFTVRIMPQPHPHVSKWTRKTDGFNCGTRIKWGRTVGLPLRLLAVNPQLHLHFQLRRVFLPLFNCGQPSARVAKGGLLQFYLDQPVIIDVLLLDDI